MESMIMSVEDIGWENYLADRTRGMSSSIIRELLKLTQKPDIISFAGGLPAPEFFPIREFDEACHYILTQHGEVALQYSPTEGFTPLIEYLAETMSKYGIWVELTNILPVSGSQQGLDLIGKIFLNPGTKIITGRPTYLGALQAWTAYQAQFLTVPLDEDGMMVDELPSILDANPDARLLYVLTNFHNPAGTTLPYERRLELAKIARHYDLVLIEDDPYGELRYEGEYITPLFCLAPERTIYLSTFSKTLTPGIRLAWVTAPKPVISRLIQAKQGADLHTGTFVQMITHDICRRGLLRQHVKNLRKAYRKRMYTMLDALAEHMPEGVTWTHPKGGLFLWATVPDAIDTAELLETAAERNVAYVPGFAFYPEGEGGQHSMRLNFSNADEEHIVEGIYRLGTVLKETLRG
ncbi:MAG: PLP-dependent aminotransferase family protein [Anaerolineales bacterium]|nr:PLP-dependent aminotransferase family protein [Anaerolineales bacterium]